MLHSCVFHVSWVVVEYFVAQSCYVYVRVNLRCSYVFVSEHFLYGTQVRSALQQCGGEGVAQRVWRHCLDDASVACHVLYHYQDHGACEVCSSAVEEHVFFLARLYVHQVAVVEPQLYLVQCVVRDGYEALFVALARDAQVFVAGEHVTELKVDEF